MLSDIDEQFLDKNLQFGLEYRTFLGLNSKGP
jgi:hypothetical protein